MADPNYITREGARRLQEELSHLLLKERRKVVEEVATAAAHGDRSENAEYIYGKKRLREIDKRIHFLTKRLDLVQVVEPEDRANGSVLFGATVEVEDEDGKRARYCIVGEDEIDLTRGRISWKSPLGRAILKKRAGDVIVVKRPGGDAELTVLSVTYEANDDAGRTI